MKLWGGATASLGLRTMTGDGQVNSATMASKRKVSVQIE